MTPQYTLTEYLQKIQEGKKNLIPFLIEDYRDVIREALKIYLNKGNPVRRVITSKGFVASLQIKLLELATPKLGKSDKPIEYGDAYFRTMIHNLACDYGRRYGKRNSTLTSDKPDPSPDPSKCAEDREAFQRIWQEFSPEEQALIESLKIRRKSWADIAGTKAGAKSKAFQRMFVEKRKKHFPTKTTSPEG